MPQPLVAAKAREPKTIESPAGHPLLSPIEILALCVAIAASTGLIHWQMIDVAREKQQMFWHQNVVTGRAPYPDQYRVLTYFMAEGLILLGMPFKYAHVLLRFVFTTASLWVFHRYLTYWLRPTFALTGIFMVAAALPLTFLYYFMQPTEPLNMLVFFLAFLAFQRQRDNWLIPLVIVGVPNRETAVLLPLLYAAVRWGQVPIAKWLPRCLLATAIAGGIYLGLRFAYGLAAPYETTSIGAFWRYNLTDPVVAIQLFGFFSLAIIVGWRSWNTAPLFLKRAAVVMLPAFFLLHLSVGYVREIRLFLPVLPITVPFALIALQRRAKATGLEARL